MTTRWKFLNLERKKIKSASGNLTWTVGEWQKVDGKLELCENGLHCSKKIYEAFSYVQGEVLTKVEVKGKSEKQNDKEVWSDMRIIETYKWTKKDSVALSIFSAELCLKEFEELYPDDKRPRQAIEAARAVLLHDTAKNRSAARSAAESAAWSAARSAAWSAARSAAFSAAWSARSAESAWSSAAWSAWSAARSAWSARSAAIKQIEKWFIEHLSELERL